MKGLSVVVLMATVMFTGGYLYYTALAICPIPLEYRIGDIDERFSLTKEEARLAAADAESVWEDATGRNLFTYDENADFTINFIYDDRQSLLDAEGNFKDRLDAAENVNDAITNKYSELVAEYESLKTSYEDSTAAYEAELATYNETVRQYNEEGGAPPDVYDELESEKAKLDREQQELNQVVKQLNDLVDEINQVGKQGNELIETYNRGVDTYNRTFGEAREFTQGDYQGDFINIYTFNDDEELELVLAHELGHAIHLGHVEGEESVMYYLIGGQPEPLELSITDMEEFGQICGTGIHPFLERLKIVLGL